MVAFRTRFDQWRSYGYVAGVGAELFLLAQERDCLLDGFRVHRLRDVRELEAPHRYCSFVEEALRLDGQRWRAPNVLLTSWSALLSSLAPSRGLVVIHREQSYPNETTIGLVSSVGARTVSLQLIDPNAEFDEEVSTYKLMEITSVGWAGQYERALLKVWAKRHPKLSKAKPGRGKR